MKTTIALIAAFITLVFAASAGAATLRLTPAKVRPGALVTAVGSGFPGSHAGTITVAGRRVARVHTGPGGAFRKHFRVPRLGRGQAGVLASVFGGRVRSALIIGRTRSSSMTAVSTGQRVLVAPAGGVSGTVVRVSGAGFAPGVAVKILYDGSVRAQLSARVARRGRATFATRFRLPATKGGANTLTVQAGGRRVMAIPFRARVCSPVCLPYSADFTLDHGGIKDKHGIGTGFTNVVPSARYKQANLSMNTTAPGTLAITATKGIAIGTANDQDNMLGVGVPGGVLSIATVLRDIPATTDANEQAGIWFGKDQDTYVKLVVWSDPSPNQDKIELLWDVAGNQGGVSDTGSFTGKTVALRLVVDPNTRTLTGFYDDGSGPTRVPGGDPIAPPGLFGGPIYAGIFATSRNRAAGAGPLAYTFDSFAVGRTSVAPGGGPGTAGTWTRSDDMPQAVLDAGSAELGGKLYMVAGKIAGGPPTPHIATLHIYNPATHNWSTGADLPYGGVENPAVVAYNGKLYAFGGGTGAFSGAVDSAAVYDPGADSWTMLAPMHFLTTTGVDTPVRRSGAAAEVIGDKIYVVGGMDENGAAKATVLEYTPATNTWARKRDITVRGAISMRDNPGSASFGGFLYIFGGRVNSSRPSVNNVDRFDPSTNTWTNVAAMPTARRSMAVSILNGKILVMGGEGGQGATGFVTGANEEYDPATNTWVRLESMPTPRHGAGAGSINGTIYVAGGSPKAGKGFTAVNEAFTLP